MELVLHWPSVFPQPRCSRAVALNLPNPGTLFTVPRAVVTSYHNIIVIATP